MSEGWVRVSEAAAVLSVSESTVRRRLADGQLRGRVGKSGRQEVWVEPAAPATPPHETSDGPSPQEMIERYERMAGGSLMLAQQRADELSRAASAAYENLAHARSQLRQLRKVALAGWATCAGVMLIGFALTLGLGVRAAEAQAQAQTQTRALDHATQHIDELTDQLARARDLDASERVAGTLADAE